MRRKKWEYITIQEQLWQIVFLCFRCMKKLEVWMPIYKWETSCLPACVWVPPSVWLLPCMLIKSVWACDKKKKKKKKVRVQLCVQARECVRARRQVYAFYVCMKCAGVWVGAGLCKYWCIAVRKAITNPGPRASLYWERRESEEEEGGTHKNTHIHGSNSHKC